jgi:hypothetical protein
MWLSRSGDQQVASFFRGVTDPVIPQNLPQAISQLFTNGALWLSGGSNLRDIYEKGGPGANFTGGDASNDSDVLGCTWSKDTMSPAGSFSFQLKPRYDYGELIKPADLILIFMDSDHRHGFDTRTNGTLVTVGIVDSVGTSVGVDGSGATVTNVSVSGRDLGAIFQETQTIFDTAFAQVDQEWMRGKFIQAISDYRSASLSPIETILTILDLIYNRHSNEGGAIGGKGSKLVGSQWVLPDTKGVDSQGRPLTILSLVNVTAFTQAPMYGYALASSLGVAQAGTVWSLLDGFANRLVNEFFFDVRDFVQEEFNTLQHLEDGAAVYLTDEDITKQETKKREIRASGVFNQSTLDIDLSRVVKTVPDAPPTPVPALVHRQMPYDSDTFKLLPTHYLHYTETYDYDVTYDTHNTVNFFRVSFPDLQAILQELVFGVMVNLEGIVKYGIRRMEGETRFSFVSSKLASSYRKGGVKSPPFLDSIKYYISLLATWHAANDQMYTGQISCRFRPEIRVGTRLKYMRVDETEISFYVIAVNHSFSVQQGASRTSLSVVRGVDESRNYLPNRLGFRPRSDEGNRSVAGMNIPTGFVQYAITTPIKGFEWQALKVETEQKPKPTP